MTAAAPRAPYALPVRRVAIGAIEPQGHRVVCSGRAASARRRSRPTAPGPVAFIDLDDSLPILRRRWAKLDIRRVGGIAGWQDVRDALHSDGWDEVRTIVIDSATKAEELALEWTLRNVRHEKDGVVIRRIEDYGFGKGYQHNYETFLPLLSDLDQHVRAGRNVVLIMHDCTATVPNPKGEDYIRWEPRLQSPAAARRRSACASASGSITCCTWATTWNPPRTAKPKATARGRSTRRKALVHGQEPRARRSGRAGPVRHHPWNKLFSQRSE
jgi:hypothetical protein